MNRPVVSLISYLLIVIGFVSLILGMIGLELKPLLFLDRNFGAMASLAIKLLIILVGIVALYVSRTYKDEADA